MRRYGTEDGFTLLETLLALIIFVACYLLVHHSVALGWRGVKAAHSETAAVQIGQSLLVEAGIGGALTDGRNMGGTEDGYRWSVDVSPYDPLAGESRGSMRVAAYRIAVEVNWMDPVTRRTRTVRLDTVKLSARR